MTKFNNYLIEIGFKDLVHKSDSELMTMLDRIYAHCVEEHGLVKGNFFTENWTQNTDIKTGTIDGCDVHHKWEHDPDNMEVCSLSDKETAKYWYDQGYTLYQLAEYLVRANWVEHQAIHAIIDTLRTRQYGAYRPGCIQRRAPMLNRFFNDQEGYLKGLSAKEFTSKKYFLKALEVIKDETDTYVLIMDEWANANGIQDWLIFGYELESLENCFEVYVED